MANRLTDATVKAAKAGVSKTTGKPATRDLYDASEPGLCLRIQPSGRKSWGLRIQVGGRMRRYDLGEYPATGLAEVRETARMMRRAVAQGSDPVSVLRPPPPPEIPSVSEAVEKYLGAKAGDGMRSIKNERRRFALHILPALGDRRVDQVLKASIDDVLQALVRQDMQVEPNRVFTSLTGFWRWAVEQRGYRVHNPMLGMRKPVRVEPSQARQKAGTVTVLDLDELRCLWRLCTSSDVRSWRSRKPPTPSSVGGDEATTIRSSVLPDLVRCLIGVPLRREEWTRLRWSEVREVVEDGWRGVALKIPASRMKGSRAATVPLPAQIIEIIEARRGITGWGEHVFAVPGALHPFGGWKYGAGVLKKALREAVGRAEDWTVHDLRRSVATALARDLHSDEGIIQRILQHSDTKLLGITAIYQRSPRLAEQAEALQAWCDLVERDAAAGEVVKLDTVRTA